MKSPRQNSAPRPLLIGPDEKAAIARLVEKAQAQPISFAQIQRRAVGAGRRGEKVDGFAPFTIAIPIGFTATFTIENRGRQGMVRHLLIAADREGRVPHPAAVTMLLEEFGFRGTAGTVDAAWFEDLGGREALNLVELITVGNA